MRTEFTANDLDDVQSTQPIHGSPKRLVHFLPLKVKCSDGNAHFLAFFIDIDTHVCMHCIYMYIHDERTRAHRLSTSVEGVVIIIGVNSLLEHSIETWIRGKQTAHHRSMLLFVRYYNIFGVADRLIAAVFFCIYMCISVLDISFEANNILISHRNFNWIDTFSANLRWVARTKRANVGPKVNATIKSPDTIIMIIIRRKKNQTNNFFLIELSQ